MKEFDIKYLGRGLSFYSFSKDGKRKFLVLNEKNKKILNFSIDLMNENDEIDYFVYRIKNNLVFGEHVILPELDETVIDVSTEENKKFYMVNIYSIDDTNDWIKSVMFKGKPKKDDENLIDLINVSTENYDELIF